MVDAPHVERPLVDAIANNRDLVHRVVDLLVDLMSSPSTPVGIRAKIAIAVLDMGSHVDATREV
jgi:hypothetical protein